jgi:hypothetical protein
MKKLHSLKRVLFFFELLFLLLLTNFLYIKNDLLAISNDLLFSLGLQLMADLVPIRLQQLNLMRIFLMFILQFLLLITKLIFQAFHQRQKVLFDK